MAAAHDEKWGYIFSEIVQAVLNDLSNSQTDALSVWMEAEKHRLLSAEPMLFVPGANYPI